MTRRSSSRMTLERRDGADKSHDVRVAEAVNAVCDELGISDTRGRALIAQRVSEAYARGPRQPLNLVQAGLNT